MRSSSRTRPTGPRGGPPLGLFTSHAAQVPPSGPPSAHASPACGLRGAGRGVAGREPPRVPCTSTQNYGNVKACRSVKQCCAAASAGLWTTHTAQVLFHGHLCAHIAAAALHVVKGERHVSDASAVVAQSKVQIGKRSRRVANGCLGCRPEAAAAKVRVTKGVIFKGSTDPWVAWRVACGGHDVFRVRAAMHLQHCRLQPLRQRRALPAQLDYPG